MPENTVFSQCVSVRSKASERCFSTSKASSAIRYTWGSLRADTRWPNLLISKELGAFDKRQLGVAALVNGTTRAGPMSGAQPMSVANALAVASAVGLTCELRLDLTLIKSPEYGIFRHRVNE